MINKIIDQLENNKESKVINKLLIKDSSGKKSVTMTAFVLGFLVVNAKLLFSGMVIGGLTLSPFTGTEYAAAIAALGAVYVLRRRTDPEVDKPVGEEK